MAGHVQDMPPPGGFADVSFKRSLPKRGPSGVVLFLAGGSIMAAGMYRVIQGSDRRRNLKTEKLNARKAMLPFLQAEIDRNLIRSEHDALQREAKIMSEVKGWKVGEKVYHTDRYVPPAQPVRLGELV